MARREAELYFKDEALDGLANIGNVAQFVSFGPDKLEQRYCRMASLSPNHRFADAREAIDALLARAAEGSVNVRSFAPDQPKGGAFHYGLTNADDALAQVRALAAEGLHTIVNELIDVDDGGVSGVAFSGIVEFAPGDTARCVEKPGFAELPMDIAIRLIETVYHFKPKISFEPGVRVEFSLHPLRRGYRFGHTVLWEHEQAAPAPLMPQIGWPNRFSRHVGDKAYGLLIADAAGLPVPETIVIPRALAPFRFGQPTATGETWLRTCPREQVPGKYTTTRGWSDPFELLKREDPEVGAIASVVAQSGVTAEFSGALLTCADGGVVVEGVAGTGQDFMQGRAVPDPLPAEVHAAVMDAYAMASSSLGVVRMEWVYDGRKAWVVQLHVGASPSAGRVIFPGDAHDWRRFRVEEGIDALRMLIETVHGSMGVVLMGHVGMTSHMADLLRRAEIPSRIEVGPAS